MPEDQSAHPHDLARSRNEPGPIGLTKLQKQLTKLPRNLRGGEITNVRRRLDAVSTAGGGLPIPKGPMPTSSRSVRRQR